METIASMCIGLLTALVFYLLIYYPLKKSYAEQFKHITGYYEERLTELELNCREILISVKFLEAQLQIQLKEQK